MGLFGSKEDKEKRKELEKQVKTLFKKFELSDLNKLCQNVLGKEIEPWRKKDDEFEKNGKMYQEYHPIERSEYEDYIWKHIKKNDITYEQLQDFAIRHSLVPRYYFDGNGKNKSSQDTRRDFPDEIKREILKRQDYNCNKCGSFLGSPDFDHIDGDNSNNSIKNCQALCPTCHRKKTGQENADR